MVASRSINVKWQHKSQDTSEVTKYILQYKEGEGKYYFTLIRYVAWNSLLYTADTEGSAYKTVINKFDKYSST